MRLPYKEKITLGKGIFQHNTGHAGKQEDATDMKISVKRGI
jgi:hypothetical protein